MGDGASKALSFANTMALMREQLGEALYARVLAALPADTLQLVQAPPLSNQWVPIRHLQGLLRATEQVLGDARSAELCAALGEKLLQRDLSSVYKVILRIATVDMVVTRGGQIFSQYFKSAGALTLARTGAKSLIAKYRSLPEASASYAKLMAGAVVGTLSMTGERRVRICQLELRKPGDVDVFIDWA